MHLRLCATPLVAATLLLSTLSCSKKEEAAASATGSYKLDGQTKSCQVEAYASTSTSGGLSYDYLTINLITTPQPTTGEEKLRLYFLKPTAQPSSAYALSDIAFYTKGNATPYFFTNNITTINSASGGGFTGTFSAKAVASGTSTPTPYSAITDGVFANVRP